MKKQVLLDKRSKKAQKEYYSKQRLSWGALNQVTRSVPSGKTYNREKDKQKRRRIGKEFRDGFDADFLICFQESIDKKRKLAYNNITNKCKTNAKRMEVVAWLSRF